MEPSSPATSLTLLDQLRQPNRPDAWKRFEQLYTRLLQAWARRQGFQDADVADLVQEVFVKLMKELPHYTRTPGGTFRGWLSRLTTNVCHDFRRRKATRALPPADGLSGVNEQSPVEFEEVEYRKSLVDSGLTIIRTEFEPKTWAAFEQLMVHNRRMEDVAIALGLSKNAIYIAKSRVLTRLRQVIDGLLD
jgi:RNA polymerase sigma-70 factor, ECF subfamily